MFLYRKNNILRPEVCRQLIQTFENSDEKRPGVLYGPNGVDANGGKQSLDITFNPSYLQHQEWGPLLGEVVEVVEQGKNEYIRLFENAFTNLDPFQLDTYFNIQKYSPNQAFTQYHCERAGLKHSNRILVWMIYLNTVTDFGQTEFYYQHHFEQAEEGKLVIWPTDWTYLHRGIPSPSQDKYILTGWYTHINPQ